MLFLSDRISVVKQDFMSTATGLESLLLNMQFFLNHHFILVLLSDIRNRKQFNESAEWGIGWITRHCCDHRAQEWLMEAQQASLRGNPLRLRHTANSLNTRWLGSCLLFVKKRTVKRKSCFPLLRCFIVYRSITSSDEPHDLEITWLALVQSQKIMKKFWTFGTRNERPHCPACVDRGTLQPMMEHVLWVGVGKRAAGSFVACRFSFCLRWASAAAPPWWSSRRLREWLLPFSAEFSSEKTNL